MMFSTYYNFQHIAEKALNGEHRSVIGGLWDEIGTLQMDWLVNQGLKPHHKLLDIGCGSLRLGTRAVGYLEAGNYWGTDLNEVLMQVGREKEIVAKGMADKLPAGNLIRDEEFNFNGVPPDIDYVMATSVFTHLPLNHLRYCLARLAGHMNRPCRFYFTIFTPQEGLPVTQKHEQSDGVETFSHKDPYHYSVDDIMHAAKQVDCEIDYVGDWGHPRNQKMVLARF